MRATFQGRRDRGMDSPLFMVKSACADSPNCHDCRGPMASVYAEVALAQRESAKADFTMGSGDFSPLSRPPCARWVRLTEGRHGALSNPAYEMPVFWRFAPAVLRTVIATRRPYRAIQYRSVMVACGARPAAGPKTTVSYRGHSPYRWPTLATLAVLLSLALPAAAQKPQNTFDVEAREYYGTPQSEAAVRRGLEYLAANQQPNGHWDSGVYRDDTAISGLCTLAFLSAGNQPGRGKYGDLLARAADYLADSVRRDGLVNRPGSAGPPMYGHGFATLALAELYGMNKRPDFREKLESAVHLIETTQNAEGGWRYQPGSSDADISVTAVQVLAIRAAANAGIKVPEETVQRAVAYIKRCANNGDGGFSYQTTQHGAGPARSGAAVTCLMLSGQRTSPECLAGVRYLQEHPIETDEWQYRQHEFYAYYYCTQAMYQVGGDAWRDWFVGYTSKRTGQPVPGIRDRLVGRQDAEGWWEERSGVGREYATAMAVLVLQVPAGLLPIYQK